MHWQQLRGAKAPAPILFGASLSSRDHPDAVTALKKGRNSAVTRTST
jgi:hypothetical protein